MTKEFPNDEIFEKFKNKFLIVYQSYQFYFKIFGIDENIKNINHFVPALGSYLQRICIGNLLSEMRSLIHNPRDSDIGFQKFILNLDDQTKRDFEKIKKDFEPIHTFVNKHIAHHTDHNLIPLKTEEIKSIIERLLKIFKKIHECRTELDILEDLNDPIDDFDYILRCLKEIDALDSHFLPYLNRKMSLEDQHRALDFVFKTLFPQNKN